ncbi:hypothetical protein [Streptococcus merionis]|uniref:Uncharacterized protein n=1 Tax=Streptococcus merionis TaxID=400065 RepID=A0A239SRQ0_9STRE|nr:hypothetical protein [Streptococcus merionis]SNU88165.1 Uncharacterised protein [Streptococcus merionis]
MKKNLLISAASLIGVTLLGLIFFQSKVQSSTSTTVGDSLPENQTIRIMYEKWRNASEEEVNAYFQPFSDDKKIIADPSGGFLTSIDDNYTVSKRQDWTGRDIVQSFDDPKVAATIGEVKAYLREH